MPRTVTLDDTIADVLRRATINGDVLTLPPGNLDRKTYVAVNQAIEALGGKWNRRVGGHVFTEPVGDRIADLLDAGQVTANATSFFPTPPELADRLVRLAEVEPHHEVLEPSAGHGAIADALSAVVPPRQLCLVEILPANCRVLRAKGYEPVEDDFLTARLLPVDRVVMNPPFERKQDIEHVERALTHIKPGGRLVSVMASGIRHNSDRKTAAFRSMVEQRGWIEDNEPGSFKAAGTNVNTVTVVINA